MVSSYTIGGKVTAVATMENSKKSPQKIKNGTIHDLASTLLDIDPKIMKTLFQKIYVPLC